MDNSGCCISIFREIDGKTIISRTKLNNQVVCVVNQIGSEIITRLNGHNTIEDISNVISTKINIKRTNELDAKRGITVDPRAGILLSKKSLQEKS